MDDLIQHIETEYYELEAKLQDPAFILQKDAYIKASKRFSELAPLMEELKKYRLIEKQAISTRALLEQEQDQELIKAAKEEIERLNEEQEELRERLGRMFSGLNRTNETQKEQNRVFLEIRAGTGGEEAALFAYDLFRMYQKYAEAKGWTIIIINESKDDLGGYKEVVAEIAGKGVFEVLKYESGVHRVQRIPETEKSGRIHTSTATVAVLPVVENAKIDLDPKDLKIEFTRSSGPGGQNVNKLETAVRITHIPTGMVVICQSERHQHQNRERALEILKSKLYQLQLEEQQKKIVSERRKQVGSGERAEKIRTYNFPQDRITDHRLRQSWKNMARILNGDLDLIFKEFCQPFGETDI